MAELLTLSSLVGLLTLTILEIVLGIDNVIFIAIISGTLPEERRQSARTIGLALALVGRIGLVLGISWLLRLETALFTAFGHGLSVKDLILLAGGLFLLYKAVNEIYKTTELVEEGHETKTNGRANMVGVIAQIVVIDIVFALDSVLTAVGLTEQIVIIIIAMSIAILIMMLYAGKVADFIHEHPSLKVLALSFLVLVGVLLISDSFGQEIERTYVYFAIMFSLAVEVLNFRRQRNAERRGIGSNIIRKGEVPGA